MVDIGSADVNAYLQEVTGQEFTSKDFRTWAGTVLAATILRECDAADSAALAKKNIVQAVEQVARRLGNTKAVCRKCYIHPAVLEAYLDGSMANGDRRSGGRTPKGIGKLTSAESAVLTLLQRRVTRRAG